MQDKPHFYPAKFFHILAKGFGLLALALLPMAAMAQEKQPTVQDGNAQIEADALEQVVINGQKVRKFTGNVVVKQKGQTLRSQEAYQYTETNRTVFMGGVRIEQGEGQLITGDSLIIQGKSRVAHIRGNVNYNEGTRSLTTQALDYDMESGNASYTTGGTINDNGTVLVSKRGIYNKATGKMHFRGDVKMTNPEMNMLTDSLDYDGKTKLADFYGPSTITSSSGTIVSTRGTYNTETGKGLFQGRSNIDSPDYRLSGDVVDFDRTTKNGYAKGNVVLFTKEDSVTITADRGFYNRSTRMARLYGNTLIKAPAARGDTLYIRSDSVRAFSDKADTTKQTLIARSRVKIFKADFQAVCDSLVYRNADSTITFYRNPYIWSDKNQMSGDTIVVRLENNKMDSLKLIRNAFIISQDTLKNFNQVKGRLALADFENNKIKKADVIGNGQSLFFAVDDKKMELQGLNRIICSRMVIRFDSTNRPSTITAITKPEANFIPPHELAEPDKKLKGFNWKPNLRPTFENTVRQSLAPAKKQSKKKPEKSSKKTKKPSNIKPKSGKERLTGKSTTKPR